MAKVVHKIVFAGAAGQGADSDSTPHTACIPDPVLNREVVDGVEQEKTSFAPGDLYYFLVQYDPTLAIAQITSSSGSVAQYGAVTRQHEQTIELPTADDPVGLSYTPSASPSVRWYGNAPALSRDGRDLSWSSGPLPAIGVATYQSVWTSCRLTPPSMTLAEGEDWPVLIVITLREV